MTSIARLDFSHWNSAFIVQWNFGTFSFLWKCFNSQKLWLKATCHLILAKLKTKLMLLEWCVWFPFREAEEKTIQEEQNHLQLYSTITFDQRKRWKLKCRSNTRRKISLHWVGIIFWFLQQTILFIPILQFVSLKLFDSFEFTKRTNQPTSERTNEQSNETCQSEKDFNKN